MGRADVHETLKQDETATLRPYLESYGRMVLIRLFEQELHRLFLKGEVHGTTHLAAGQEAIPVGVCQALRPDDYVAGTYRGHGHALAKGTAAEGMVAEMLGRATGTCGGRSGSMNVIDRARGLVGCYGIVGGSIAAATGAGLSAQRQGRVSVALFGDGATNQAYFFECLNLAKVLNLPVVYVCENNWYGEFTPMHTVTAGADIAKRAEPFAIPARVVDGNDLFAVVDAAREAIDRARANSGPTLLECQTYRHYGHSKSDPASYRPPEEGGALDGARPAADRPPAPARRGRRRGGDPGGRGGDPPRARRRRRGRAGRPVPRPRRQGDRVRARMSALEFRVAIRDAIAEEMERDATVVFFGEDVAVPGGVFKATPGLHERFGETRVFDTPISELALAGAAYGAAVTGLRPIFEIMFGDFMALPMDSLVNQAAKYWYISNEQGSVPLVVRSAVGAGGRFGAIHSQSHGTWFQGVPGIKIAFPSSPAEAKGLLKAAIRDPNPVVFLEHKRLYSVKGEAPPAGEVIPLGRANIARAGGDLTIATIGKGVPDALAAAEQISGEGIDVEVVDLRTLRPLDVETVLASVARTNRLLAVEEGPRTGGWATGLLGAVAEAGLHDLDDAWIVATEETPVPYSPALEDAFLPDTAKIVESVRTRLGAGVA